MQVEGSLTQTVDGMKELAKASHTFQPDFDGFLERLNEHGMRAWPMDGVLETRHVISSHV